MRLGDVLFTDGLSGRSSILEPGAPSRPGGMEGDSWALGDQGDAGELGKLVPAKPPRTSLESVGSARVRDDLEISSDSGADLLAFSRPRPASRNSQCSQSAQGRAAAVSDSNGEGVVFANSVRVFRDQSIIGSDVYVSSTRPEQVGLKRFGLVMAPSAPESANLGLALICRGAEQYVIHVYDVNKQPVCSLQINEWLSFECAYDRFLLVSPDGLEPTEGAAQWCFEMINQDILVKLASALLVAKSQYLRGKSILPTPSRLCFVTLRRGNDGALGKASYIDFKSYTWRLPKIGVQVSDSEAVTDSVKTRYMIGGKVPRLFEVYSDLATHLDGMALGEKRLLSTFDTSDLSWHMLEIEIDDAKVEKAVKTRDTLHWAQDDPAQNQDKLTLEGLNSKLEKLAARIESKVVSNLDNSSATVLSQTSTGEDALQAVARLAAKNHALAERLEYVEQQLAAKTREVDDLQSASYSDLKERAMLLAQCAESSRLQLEAQERVRSLLESQKHAVREGFEVNYTLQQVQNCLEGAFLAMDLGALKTGETGKYDAKDVEMILDFQVKALVKRAIKALGGK